MKTTLRTAKNLNENYRQQEVVPVEVVTERTLESLGTDRHLVVKACGDEIMRLVVTKSGHINVDVTAAGPYALRFRFDAKDISASENDGERLVVVLDNVDPEYGLKEVQQ